MTHFQSYIQFLLYAALPFCFQVVPQGIASATEAVEAHERFPLIFYAVHDSENAFEQVKQWGGTHVHSYSKGRSADADQEFFDRAERYDLKVMANLDTIRRIRDGEGVEPLREYIARYKGHPAFGFWYLCDEPAMKVEPHELEPYYKMLKAETPSIPVAIAHEWQVGWGGFTHVQDILMNDLYPVTGAPFPEAKLGAHTKFTRAATELAKSVTPVKNRLMPVIQIMNWESLVKPGETEVRGYPLSELRYPSPAELRYMCFSSIVLGARGLGFFSYARSHQSDPQWSGRVLPPLLQEIEGFMQAVGFPHDEQLPLGETAPEVVAGIWKKDEEHFLVVLNATSEATEVMLSLHPIVVAGDLVPWGSTRETDATLNDGSLTVSAEPWETLVWKIQ